MEDDRRRAFRQSFTRLSVFDRETGELAGQLANLSENGAMLLSAEPMALNVLYRFIVELPVASKRESIAFDGTSVWCRPDDDPAWYATGFMLHTFNPRDMAKLRAVMQELERQAK